MADISKLSGGDGLRIKGFVEIELVKNNGREHYKYYNSLSEPFKEAILTSAISQFMNGKGMLFGNKSLLTPMHYHYSLNYDNYGVTNVTNVLINDSNLSAVPNAVPSPFNTDFSLNVLGTPGFADSRRNAVGNNGISIKDDVVANAVGNKIVTNKYKYEAGVGTGTITHVGMMVGSPLVSSGIRTVRLCDDIVIQEGLSYVKSTEICPPGCCGLGSSEMYINYTNDAGSTHKINLETGVIDDDPAGYETIDTSYMSDISDMIIIGDYAYILTNHYVYIFSKATMTYVGSISSLDATHGKNLFFYDSSNDRLFVTRGYYDGTIVMTELVKGSEVYFSTRGNNYSDYTELNLGITIDPTKYTIKSLGNSKIGLVDEIEGDRYDYDCNNMLICSKTLDANGRLQVENVVFGLWKTGSFLLWNDTANTYYVFDNWNSTRYVQDYVTPVVRVNPITRNQYKLSGISDIKEYQFGWTFSKASDCCQLLSLAELSTPINKGANDVLYVTYGYQVV